MPIRNIVITDLTRFNNPSLVCVAGIDINTGELFRPLDPRVIDETNKYGYLSSQICNDKNIHSGCLISANFEDYIHNPPQRPHVEDIIWNNESCKVYELPDSVFYNILTSSLSQSMQQGFGIPINDKVISPNNLPQKSIITLCPNSIVIYLFEDNKNGNIIKKIKAKINILFNENEYSRDIYLPVTDLYLHNHIQNLSDKDDYNSKLSDNNNKCFIRLGLSRYYDASERSPLDCRKGYWLQINGIYVFDRQGNRIV